MKRILGLKVVAQQKKKKKKSFCSLRSQNDLPKTAKREKQAIGGKFTTTV